MDYINIIGAGPGISYSVAQKFGKQGFKVALISRNEEKLKQQVSMLAGLGIEAMYAVGDVANETSLKLALTQIKNSYGQAKMILYNAAAIDLLNLKDIMELNWSTIRNELDVNVGGAFVVGKEILPYFLKENNGKIFFTGGGLALQGDPQWASISIGKAALRNLVQSFVRKAENTNVHVAQLTVCGFVNPTDKKYSPQAIAEQFWKLYNQKPGEFENEIIY